MRYERGKEILYHVASRDVIKERANSVAAEYGVALLDVLRNDDENQRRMLQLSSDQLSLLSLLLSRQFLEAQVSVKMRSRYLQDGRTFSGCYTAAGRVISYGTALAYRDISEIGEKKDPTEITGQLLVDYPLAMGHPETFVMAGVRDDLPIDTTLFHLIPPDVMPEKYIASRLEPVTLARDGGLHIQMHADKKKRLITMRGTIPDTAGFIEIDYHRLGTIGDKAVVYGHNGRKGTNYRINQG